MVKRLFRVGLYVIFVVAMVLALPLLKSYYNYFRTERANSEKIQKALQRDVVVSPSGADPQTRAGQIHQALHEINTEGREDGPKVIYGKKYEPEKTFYEELEEALKEAGVILNWSREDAVKNAVKIKKARDEILNGKD
jgi:hypothetical protein